MGAPPHRIAEAVVGFLLPPACREEVLGDLHERSAGTVRYLAEALGVVPLVIVSRVRRTLDPQVTLMEAFVLYLSFTGAAEYRDRALVSGSWGLTRLAIPAAVALLALKLYDAYAKPGKRGPLAGAVETAFALGTACLSQAILQLGSRDLALPLWVTFRGAGISLLLLTLVRVLFPPLQDRPVGAAGPAFWVRQTGEPMRITPGVARMVKGAGAVLLLAAVYLLFRRV
ncbi:MAG TPA: hypothetical protein VE959_17780 [Bryobacteraceae bacterium]|nr:hypothetical protein [Bryobacteraceae bacterium]